MLFNIMHQCSALAQLAYRRTSTPSLGGTVLRQMRAATLTSFGEVARFVGLDPFELMRDLGIKPADLEDPENRIAARLVINLLEESAKRSGCPASGFSWPNAGPSPSSVP